MSTPPYTYEYDPTGLDPTNLIANEIHSVTAPVDPLRANFIVPRAAPFFRAGMVVSTGPMVTDPVMVEGVDYTLTHHFLEASRSVEQPVYGSINFLNRAFTGTVYLTYQTIGGAYTLADYTIVENLTRSLYKLMTVTWAQMVGVPVAFPPTPHDHDNEDLTGVVDVLDKLQGIINAINANGGNLASLASSFNNHLTAMFGAHTPAQVGLPLVPNWAPATQDDIDNRATNKFVSPDALYHAIARFSLTGVTVSDATETWRGIIRLATSLEVDAGTLDNVAVSPLQLFNYVDSIAQAFQSATEIKVGDPYFTTVIGRDPNTFLGYGTWSRYAEGRMLVGYDANNPRFNTIGATGGEEKHQLTTPELPSHNTTLELPVRTNGGGGDPLDLPGLTMNDNPFGTVNVVANLLGEDEPHENMPPYIVIAMWVRLT